MTQTDIFDGQILGVGTTSGVRLVVGDWMTSPFGRFTDIMVAHADGRRELLAPSPEIADYVAATYNFDTVTVTDVAVAHPETAGTLEVCAGPLSLRAELGRRHPWAYPLTAVPQPWRGPGLARVINPFARLVMPGVQTYGSARNGRREAYVAHDIRRVSFVKATWKGTSLGSLLKLEPAPKFGFSSTPKTPCLTRVTTYVLHAL